MRGSGHIMIMLSISIMVFASCGNKGPQVMEEGRIRPAAYSEGDTLELDPYPTNLAAWMNFFQKKFPHFRNGEFKASGVVLHLDSLPNAGSISDATPDPHEMVVENPDSTWRISIFGGMNGDIDQSVVLWRSRTSDPGKVVMLNGPGTTVESADWLARDVFILSRSTVDIRKGLWTPEVYLFSLNDSTFTNFTWTRSVPVDSVIGAADEFLEHMKSGNTLKK